MDVLLWERNLDAVGVKGFVDGVQHVADDIRLLDSIGPYEHFEIDAGVAQLANNGLGLFGGVHPLVFHVVDGCIDKGHGLLQVGTVGHAVWYDLQHIAMIACQVLIVFGEQL